MNAIAVIQARMSSQRLPQKVLKPLSGKPMIWHIYQRVSQCKLIDKVVVATSIDSSDDALASFCSVHDMNCHRGSLENVLQRFLTIRQQHPQSKYVVRITGDCPLIHPPFIDAQIQALEKYRADITWLSTKSSLLDGQSATSWKALEHVNSMSSLTKNLEHVGSPYIATHPDEFRIVELGIPPSLSQDNFRLTVDEMADYNLMERLYEQLWQPDSGVNLYHAIAWLKTHGDIAQINQNVVESAINKEVHQQKRQWHDVPKVGVWEFVEAE